MTLPNRSTIQTYGGPYNDAVQTVDPSSEVSSVSFNPLINDVASLTQTAPICLFQFTGSASAPAITSSSTWATGFDSMWGNSAAVQPTLTRTGTGAITVNLPASVSDSLGNSILTNIRAARVSTISGSTPAGSICHVASSSQFTITLSSSGIASDFSGTLFLVEIF